MTAAPKLNTMIKPQSTHVIIELPSVPTNEELETVLRELESLFANGAQDCIFICDKVHDLSGGWRRGLVGLHKQLKAQGKQIRLAGVSEPLQRGIRADGLDQSLKASAHLKAALIELGHLKEKTLDVKFVNPFLAATVKVIATQSSTQAKAGQVFRKSARDKFHGDISGVIGLISEAFTGSVVISFPAPTFLGIMSRMLGEECKEINKDIEDGAGELTNIIFGQAKIALNEQGYGIQTALPSVVTGQQHSILQMSNGPRVVIPFETDLGPFFVEICTSDP